MAINIRFSLINNKSKYGNSCLSNSTSSELINQDSFRNEIRCIYTCSYCIQKASSFQQCKAIF